MGFSAKGKGVLSAPWKGRRKQCEQGDKTTTSPSVARAHQAALRISSNDRDVATSLLQIEQSMNIISLGSAPGWEFKMVASDSFAEFLREQFSPLGRLTFRRMFVKTGVFCDGVMLGMVADNTLYFRVDEENKATFEEAAAFPPLNYSKKGFTIDLGFWRAPERLFDEPDEFLLWARSALAA